MANEKYRAKSVKNRNTKSLTLTEKNKIKEKKIPTYISRRGLIPVIREMAIVN